MMAGWFDKLRRAVEPDEEPYDDFDDEEIYPQSNTNMDNGTISTNNNAQMGNMYNGSNPPSSQFGGYGGQQQPNPNTGAQHPNNYGMNNQPPVNNSSMIPTSGIPITGNQSSLEIIMLTPTEKDGNNTIGQIAQHLMNNRVVHLNLENTNKERSRRYLDFLRGVAFAIRGEVKQAGTSTYILSPSNVSLLPGQDRDDDKNSNNRIDDFS